MEDLEHIVVVDEQVEQGREIESLSLGIDRRGFVGAGDLHQAQVRPIGVLAHEFGVDRDEIGAGKAFAELKQRVAVGNERVNEHGAS